MTDTISNRSAGMLADRLAETQNYYGGDAGIRSSIRHAIGASYLFQGNPLLKDIGKTVTTPNPFGIVSSDEELDLWYHPDGPQIDKIKDKHSVFGISTSDMQTLTDKTNNNVGVEQLSGLSFEERYEKMTGLVKEQLEYFAETGAFKKGLPVWNTEAEGTFETKGIIKTPEDAKKQLEVIAKGEQDLIDDRRMGLLRKDGDLSDIGQVAERSREEQYTKNLNYINTYTEKNKKIKEDIDEFKKINATRLSETKKVGRGNAKVLTKNAQQANKELEKLEKNYDRNLKSIKGWQELVNEKELKGNVEFIFDKVMEEQEFLNAGNDWVLQ